MVSVPAKMSGISFTKYIQGKVWKAEGVLGRKNPVLKDPLPDSIEIFILRDKGKSKSSYENTTVGGPVTCPISHMIN